MLYKDDSTLNTFVRYTVTPDMLNVNWTLVCLWWNSTGSSNYTERSREGRQGQTGSLSSRRRQFRAGTRSTLVEVKTNSGFVLVVFLSIKVWCSEGGALPAGGQAEGTATHRGCAADGRTQGWVSLTSVTPVDTCGFFCFLLHLPSLLC